MREHRRLHLGACLLVIFATALFGINASPALAGTISVAWDPVGDTDLAGYRVEWGNSPGTYTFEQNVSPGTTELTLNGVTDCTDWYVAVRAVDDADNLSPAFSNEVAGWARPTVAAVGTPAAEQGLSLDLSIQGTNFRNGATVEFGDTGITVSSVSVVSCTEVVASITVGSGASVGSTSVTVVNSDQTFGTAASLFTVDAAVAPTVASVSPADGASGVSAAVQPTVTLSEAVDPASVTASTVLLIDSADSPVSQSGGSPDLSADGLTVTLTPSANLTMGETYRLQVLGGAGGVKDLAGNPLASTFTQTTGFSTVSDTTAPSISAVAAGAVDGTSATITWVTDEPADGQVFFRVQGGTEYQSSDQDTALVTDHSLALTGLQPDTTYEYQVRSKDAAGNQATSADSILTTTASSFVYLRFEAESGELTAPLSQAAGAGAFGNAWVELPAGSPQGTSNNPSGSATFGVNLPVTDNWYLWVRMYGPSPSADSFFESVDGGNRQSIFPDAAGEWLWTPGRSYALDAGLHAIELGGREAEARADRVLLTNDPNFVPTEQPVDDTTPPASPAGASATPGDTSITLSWTNPSDSDLDRVIIRYRTDGVFPTSPVDGVGLADRAVNAGAADSEIHAGVTNGVLYTYALFAVDGDGNVSTAAQVASTPVDNEPPAPVTGLRRTDTTSGP